MGKMCPCCKDIELRIAIRRGVEIDYCPECNGIWLDNGELNKIVSESVKASDEENAAEESRKSFFLSIFSLMGSTKDDAEEDSDSSDSGGNK